MGRLWGWTPWLREWFHGCSRRTASLARNDPIAQEDHSLRRVPILSGIPVIGEAFKNDEINKSASELIVFVTPRIVSESTGSQVASAGPSSMGAREQEQGVASRQDLIEQTLNRLEKPSL